MRLSKFQGRGGGEGTRSENSCLDYYLHFWPLWVGKGETHINLEQSFSLGFGYIVPGQA